jgi:thioredoxin 1
MIAGVSFVTLAAMVAGCSNEQEEKGNAVKTRRNDVEVMKQTHELTLTDANFTAETDKGVVLVDFWAPWCGPCKWQGPIVEKVAAAMAGQAKVGKCNVDEAPTSAEKFGVRSIPTLVVLKDGKEVERFVGVQQEAALIAVLKKHLGGDTDGEHAKR